jgi:hypothetical protein
VAIEILKKLVMRDAPDHFSDLRSPIVPDLPPHGPIDWSRCFPVSAKWAMTDMTHPIQSADLGNMKSAQLWCCGCRVARNILRRPYALPTSFLLCRSVMTAIVEALLGAFNVARGLSTLVSRTVENVFSAGSGPCSLFGR